MAIALCVDADPTLPFSSHYNRAAGVYHQLGMVAQEQRQFDVAVDYYLKALKIYEDVGDLYRAAGVYHQLGVVAQH